MSDEAFGSFLHDETIKWDGIIRASGAIANQVSIRILSQREH